MTSRPDSPPSAVLPRALHAAISGVGVSGDTTPCRMTGVTLHGHVRYKGI